MITTNLVKNTQKNIEQALTKDRLGTSIITRYGIFTNFMLVADLKKNEKHKINDVYERVQINSEEILQKHTIITGEILAFYHRYITLQIEERPYNEVNKSIDSANKFINILSYLHGIDNRPVCSRITQEDKDIQIEALKVQVMIAEVEALQTEWNNCKNELENKRKEIISQRRRSCNLF